MDTGPVSGEVNEQPPEQLRIVTAVTVDDYGRFSRGRISRFRGVPDHGSLSRS